VSPPPPTFFRDVRSTKQAVVFPRINTSFSPNLMAANSCFFSLPFPLQPPQGKIRPLSPLSPLSPMWTFFFFLIREYEYFSSILSPPPFFPFFLFFPLNMGISGMCPPLFSFFFLFFSAGVAFSVPPSFPPQAPSTPLFLFFRRTSPS